MKVLIAVASKHGSTREIATVIAEELQAQSLTVDLLEAGEVGDVASYDTVILGSAIYAGNWLPDAKRFARVYGADLTQVPVWLFSSGPLGTDDPQPHNDPILLAAPLGEANIRDHRVFAGKLDSSELGFGERLMAKVVGAPEGDFREWGVVRDWAREIAADSVLLPTQQQA
jgi:menaquinone-dependent protoporphyrinogen oxidase